MGFELGATVVINYSRVTKANRESGRGVLTRDTSDWGGGSGIRSNPGD